MRKVDLPKGRFVSICESSKELPINRFNEFNKYLIQDAGIGSTTGDVEGHFNNLHRLLAGNKVEEAQREAYNLHYNFHLAINKISIRSLSFLILVDNIDGKSLTDYSEEGLLKTADELGRAGLTQAQVEEILSDVKKNSIRS
jgi:hypothetical protein